MIKPWRLCLTALIAVTPALFLGCIREVPNPIDQNGEPVLEPSRPIEPSSGPTLEITEPADSFIYDLKGYKSTTIQEASEIMRASVPVPAYLPDESEIKGVFIKDSGNSSRVQLIVSDQELIWENGQVECKMAIQVAWNSQGQIALKLMGKRVQVNDCYAVITRDSDVNDALWWQWPCKTSSSAPGQYEIVISASNDFPTDEFIKVAESLKFDLE
jgi:hypothetical protein